VFASPFEKGGLRGICLIKFPASPLFQRRGSWALTHRVGGFDVILMC